MTGERVTEGRRVGELGLLRKPLWTAKVMQGKTQRTDPEGKVGTAIRHCDAGELSESGSSREKLGCRAPQLEVRPPSRDFSLQWGATGAFSEAEYHHLAVPEGRALTAWRTDHGANDKAGRHIRGLGRFADRDGDLDYGDGSGGTEASAIFRFIE